MSTIETLPILIGVDGSETSIEALRTAGRLGAALDLPILAVTTWVIDPVWGGYLPVDPDTPEDLAQDLLARTVATAFDGEPPVDLETRTLYGPAATALVDASREASMLVVGSRGLGGFRGMLLGSVSTACVQHAHCPVLVIRPRPVPAAAAPSVRSSFHRPLSRSRHPERVGARSSS